MKALFFSILIMCGHFCPAQIHAWFLAAQSHAGSSLFVLDQIPKSSVAAYSLRRLTNTYSGSAIRVRRSSDNTEQDIGFDSDGNLNTSAMLSFAGAGNAYVVTWYDQSGNSRNATQSTTTNQFQIVNAGALITWNSKPYVFSDATDFVQATDPMGGSASEFVAALIIRTSATSNGAFGNASFTLHTGTNRVSTFLPWSDLNIYYDVGGSTGANRITISSQFTNATLYQFSFINSVANNQQAVRKNGTQIGSDATGHTVTTSLLRLSDASPQGVQGYLTEFIFYESTLTTTELQTIENNQIAYYGITP